MNISKLIEILAQYLQEHGDIEVAYRDFNDEIVEEITEMDLNVEPFPTKKKKLVLKTILVEDK